MKRPRAQPGRSRRDDQSQPLPRQGSPAVGSRYAVHAFWTVLALGIALRALTFVYLGYFNNDNHLAVLEYVSRHGSPPPAALLDQAYHPPLYYFLAAPLYLLGSLPAVQSLSLILSIATLAIIAIWLRGLPWIHETTRPWCLALPAFHPQFILFSLFISNDALAIFLGALIFYQGWRLLKAPSRSNHAGLAVLLGLGLLTKAVFLAFVLPLLILAGLAARGLANNRSQQLVRLAAFFSIALLLGCYKYAENFFLFGDPLISNLDFSGWTAEQKPTWIGVWSLFDLNVLKLLHTPVISAATVHSYPLMIYGSFWYALVPESTFHGNLIAPYNYLGSLIYLIALVPTILMLAGIVRAGLAMIRLWAEDSPTGNSRADNQSVYEGVCVLAFLSNLLLILWVGWRSDVWSVFQGRLLFPSYGALLLLLNRGMEWAAVSRARIHVVHNLMALLIVLFIAYFSSEIWLASQHPTSPLDMEHMPYKIDMHAH